ncbi:ABC transporter substrate-binding protein [Aerosakkonemataceae cyanobacterium BLCC-F154]|uniref:ABC transporter substrate-binding protein n=1 Tax=Floridaenema fluviatile BLCC-F154 TaxID=3153640 RepID=A0ABV4YH55_9CYAN
MKRRHLLIIGLGITSYLLPISIGCAQAPINPLRVGANVWPGYEPLFLAKNLGYYQGSAIELRNYPSATEISQAFRNGDIEVAALTMDETLLLAQTNPDIRVILITDFSNGADVLMSKPEIKTLQNLKGKKIGVESNAVGGYLLSRVLDKAGLLLTDIQVVSLGVSEHEQAYKQNLIDAVVTFEPVRSKLLEAGAKILFDSSQIPQEIIDVLVVREPILIQRQADLKVLLEGWFRALNYNQQNPLDAAQQMAIRQQVTPEQFIASLKLLTIPDRQKNLELLSKTDRSLLENTQRLLTVMLDKKLLERSIPLEPLLNEKIIKTIK